MVWSLAAALVFGTLPGVFLGVIVRINYLPDPRNFKLFVGCVLLYLGLKVAHDALTNRTKRPSSDGFKVTPLEFNVRRLRYEFNGNEHSLSTWLLLIISVAIGVIGGTYGIGGGAFLAPILVSIFRLPVYTVAGATLLATFTSSIAGVLFYTVVAPHYAQTGLAITPDFFLGAMFGIGGVAGVYTGARLQRFLPALLIKSILATGLLFIAGRYILFFFA